MKHCISFGLLVFMIYGACGPQRSNSEQIDSDSNHHGRIKTGLKIEYKPTRGQNYTDHSVTDLKLRHIPVTISNDSTIAIQVQINFSRAYAYPMAFDSAKFKVFPMPESWALDGVNIGEETYLELPAYIDNPNLNKILLPGEQWIFALGTLYPGNVNYGVFPVALLSDDNRELYHECNTLMNPNELTISILSLELVIGFTRGSQAEPDSCTTIICGHITYPG